MPTAVQLIHEIPEQQIQHGPISQGSNPTSSFNKKQGLPMIQQVQSVTPYIDFKFLGVCLHPIPGLDSLPTAGRLPTVGPIGAESHQINGSCRW